MPVLSACQMSCLQRRAGVGEGRGGRTTPILIESHTSTSHLNYVHCFGERLLKVFDRLIQGLANRVVSCFNRDRLKCNTTDLSTILFDTGYTTWRMCLLAILEKTRNML